MSTSTSEGPFSRRRRGRKIRRTEEEEEEIKKGAHPWSSEDDGKLAAVVRELGTSNWSLIASRIPGRSYKSCRARWFDYLRFHCLQRSSDLSVLDSYNSLINDPKIPQKLREYWENRKQVYLEGRCKKLHVMGSTLVEISSITICLNQLLPQQLKPPFGIYGHIILIDELGNEFIIFKHDIFDCRIIDDNDDALTLKNFKLGSPRCLPASFNVHIFLKDTFRKDFIVDENLYVDFRNVAFLRDDDDDHDDFYCSGVSGIGVLFQAPNIRLNGNINQFAVVAFVSVSLVQREKSKVNVSGRVLAGALTRRSVYHEIFLSNVPRPRIVNNKEALLVDSAAIAVPSHSSLDIKLDLTVSGIGTTTTQILDSLNFKPKCRRTFFPSKKELAAGEICSVVVSVMWDHPFHCLPESVSRQWCHDNVEQGRSSSEYAASSSRAAAETSNQEDGLNSKIIHLLSGSTDHSQTFYIQPHLRELSSREWLFRVDCERFVEVFSISICFSWAYLRDLRSDGVITVTSAGKEGMDYFKLEEMEKFPNDMRFGILYPHGPEQSCHESSKFGVALDLKDGAGREISYGYLSWVDFQHPGWMNQRISSVIPGQDGYAVVHYMIIEDALQAKLKCTLRSNDGSIVAGGHIEGDICARYSNYRYATYHDDFYYRSTLFRGRGRLGDGGELPLFKSFVAVPVISSLIVSVVIQFKLSADDPWMKMEGQATFKPPCSETTVYPVEEKQVCEIGNYSIAALVEWK